MAHKNLKNNKKGKMANLKPKKHENTSDIHNSIFELLKVDPSFTEEILVENGIELSKFDEENIEFINKLYARANIELGKNERKEKNLLEKAKAALKELIGDIKLDAFLEKTLPLDEYKQLRFQFRGLDELDKDAKIELLTDQQLLKLMEEIEKKNKYHK